MIEKKEYIDYIKDVEAAYKILCMNYNFTDQQIFTLMNIASNMRNTDYMNTNVTATMNVKEVSDGRKRNGSKTGSRE